MAITVTSLRTIVSTGASATQTSTLATTLTITPNPLTTAFEPPPYCAQSYLSNCQTDAISGTLPCFVSVYPEGVCDSNGQSCYPPVPGILDNTYLYSPGLSCPSGWSTAWKEVRTPTGHDEETTAHCCPTCVPSYISSPQTRPRPEVDHFAADSLLQHTESIRHGARELLLQARRP
jgi:hypothetical protein